MLLYAVDVRDQRQGLAAALLQFARKTAVHVSIEIGTMGILTHPIDDNARAFYSKHGFVDLPEDPRRAMIVRMVDLRRAMIG